MSFNLNTAELTEEEIVYVFDYIVEKFKDMLSLENKILFPKELSCTIEFTEDNDNKPNDCTVAYVMVNSITSIPSFEDITNMYVLDSYLRENKSTHFYINFSNRITIKAKAIDYLINDLFQLFDNQSPTVKKYIKICELENCILHELFHILQFCTLIFHYQEDVKIKIIPEKGTWGFMLTEDISNKLELDAIQRSYEFSALGLTTIEDSTLYEYMSELTYQNTLYTLYNNMENDFERRKCSSRIVKLVSILNEHLNKSYQTITDK